MPFTQEFLHWSCYAGLFAQKFLHRSCVCVVQRPFEAPCWETTLEAMPKKSDGPWDKVYKRCMECTRWRTTDLPKAMGKEANCKENATISCPCLGQNKPRKENKTQQERCSWEIGHQKGERREDEGRDCDDLWLQCDAMRVVIHQPLSIFNVRCNLKVSCDQGTIRSTTSYHRARNRTGFRFPWCFLFQSTRILIRVYPWLSWSAARYSIWHLLWIFEEWLQCCLESSTVDTLKPVE